MERLRHSLLWMGSIIDDSTTLPHGKEAPGGIVRIAEQHLWANMSQAAWMTDELAEEWVEPVASTSGVLSYRAPTEAGSTSRRLPSWSASRLSSDENAPPPGEGRDVATSTPPPLHPSTYGSIKWVGTARKPSRAGSGGGSAARTGMGMRVVSGDVEGGRGSLLGWSPAGGAATSGIESPPLSDRSGSGSGASPPAGTFVQRSTLVVHAMRGDAVGAGSQAHRGGGAGLGIGKPLRNPFAPATPGAGAAGGMGSDAGGLFAPLKLESMFRAPTPPAAETHVEAERLIEDEGERPSSPQEPAEQQEREDSAQEQDPSPLPVRRASHSYVPRRPSRLSKSVTPSSPSSGGSASRDASAVMQHDQDEENQDQDERQASGSERGSREDDADEDWRSDGGASDEHEDGGKDGTGSHGSCDSGVDATPTTTGICSRPAMRHFSGSRPGPGADAPFTFTPSPPSRSPSHFTEPPASAASASAAEARPLKLFRDTWDTYTRDQLSAIVEGVSARGTPVEGAGALRQSRRARWSGSGGPSGSSSSGSARSRGSQTPSSGSGSARSRRSWVEHPSISDEPEEYSPESGARYAANDDARSDSSDMSHPASKRIRLSASPELVKEHSRGDRRSWGEKGEDVLRRIRERQWAGTITASEMSATDGSASQGGLDLLAVARSS